MPAQWTGEIVGKMHLHGITVKQLAEAVGWNPKYLSQVLHSDEPPAKAKQKISDALNRLICSAS